MIRFWYHRTGIIAKDPPDYSLGVTDRLAGVKIKVKIETEVIFCVILSFLVTYAQRCGNKKNITNHQRM